MKTKVGVWLDQREAVLVFIKPEGEEIKKIQSSVEKHASRINGLHSTTSYEAQLVPADDRRQSSFTEHLNSYWDRIIDCIRDAESILMLGPGEAKDELRKRIARAKLSYRIVGVETVARMTERQIVAKVRTYFQKQRESFDMWGRYEARSSLIKKEGI